MQQTSTAILKIHLLKTNNFTIRNETEISKTTMV